MLHPGAHPRIGGRLRVASPFKSTMMSDVLHYLTSLNSKIMEYSYHYRSYKRDICAYGDIS
jgi:hypothetical protein